MDKQAKSRLWTILAALAAVMWGISGLFAESLFKVSSKITPIWLTQIRLIISGIVLLIIATILHQKPFSVLKDKKILSTLLHMEFLACYQYKSFTLLQLRWQMHQLPRFCSLLGHFLS